MVFEQEGRHTLGFHFEFCQEFQCNVLHHYFILFLANFSEDSSGTNRTFWALLMASWGFAFGLLGFAISNCLPYLLQAWTIRSTTRKIRQSSN